jgi:hypothetical protein
MSQNGTNAAKYLLDLLTVTNTNVGFAASRGTGSEGQTTK